MDAVPKVTNSRKNCCVKDCHNIKYKNPYVRFFSFPRKNREFLKCVNEYNEEVKVDRHDVWKRLLNLHKKIAPSATVCSAHFTSQDLIPSNGRVRHLKRNAIPSMNLPSHDDQDVQKSTISPVPELNKRIRRPLILKKNSTIYNGIGEKSSNKENEIEQTVNIENVGIDDEQSDDDRTINKEIEQLKTEKHTEMRDKQFNDNGMIDMENEQYKTEEHTKMRDKQFDDNGMINMENEQCKTEEHIEMRDEQSDDNNRTINMSDEQCKTKENLKISVKHSNDVTVLSDFKDAAVQVQKSSFITFKFTNIFITEYILSTMTGIPNFGVLQIIQKYVAKSENLKSLQNCELDQSECILLVFMKLKQSLSYEALASMIQKCDSETCESVFLKMLDVLYDCLKCLIKWPHKKNISQSIPECSHDFTDVRVIVDCTEIPLQTLNNICCRTNTYSYYAGHCTVKFMLGVTPAGLISFVSRAYGGRVPDNFIFQSSGILELLEDNDAVMADQGFTIGALCKKHNITLITSPFVKNRKQLSTCDAASGRSISAARVHIDKINQQIKTFQILNSELPTDLIPEVEKILTIACAIVNLSSPVLPMDEF